jgi:hypothetical protein
MLDPALIAKCADPSLKPAIVETFIASAGSLDPLAITVVSQGRLLLLPKPVDATEAISIIRRYAGHAVVRVGLTQMPAGIGAKTNDDLDPALFDDCRNLQLGSALFAKVMRIVAKWYGDPHDEDAARVIFEDAVLAWKTGFFEGAKVFAAEEPDGGRPDANAKPGENANQEPTVALPADKVDIGGAAMRIDLSRLGAGN